MINVVQTLLLIRLRKFLPPKDKLALVIFLFAYLLFFFCLNEKFQVIRNYSLLFSLDIFFYHINRKDIELLKLNRKWKLILFGEYFVYSSFYLALFFINKEYLLALIYLALTVTYIIIAPEFYGKIIKYPFRLFDPFWHMCWRRNKLILFLPITIFLVVVGDLYHNKNLIRASFFVASLFSALPSFQREGYESIKISHYCGKDYLYKQFKTAIVNSLIITIPLIIVLCLFQEWVFLCFTPLIFTIPILNIIFKYSFFNNQFKHQLMFTLFLSMLPLGISVIAIPFLYLKSIKTIKVIQHV
ncbi:hypothetical protein BC749_10490 [Flavobacterium araucananum]|uniref:Uncharacterized protein n=1 Tax=Flavobacterium araucananum TaxID=946678 RepID=A0A227NX04_9FLAO|nr:hypothetical protein [Flavobacterium araucananum]OXG01558.1 hypothetical protein B0A64_19020 [Flavobacterium araucananum]PWJ98944.1 hypothetical protein BC749_10490 [Flavobacterium araucananum]